MRAAWTSNDHTLFVLLEQREQVRSAGTDYAWVDFDDRPEDRTLSKGPRHNDE